MFGDPVPRPWQTPIEATAVQNPQHMWPILCSLGLESLARIGVVELCSVSTRQVYRIGRMIGALPRPHSRSSQLAGADLADQYR